MKIRSKTDAINYLESLSKVGHIVQIRLMEYKTWVQVSKDQVSLFGYEKNLVESAKRVKEQIGDK